MNDNWIRENKEVMNILEEKDLRFWLVREPYYALIKAEHELEAMDLYDEIVADVEDQDEFMESLECISDGAAIEELSKAIDEYGKPMPQHVQDRLYNKGVSDVLLIDASFI